MTHEHAVLILEGSWRGPRRVFTLFAETVIGGPQEDIEIARDHGPLAIVAWRDGAWRLRACSPSVVVEDAALADETVLQHGQMITVGEAHLRFLAGDPQQILDEDRHFMQTTDGLTDLLNRRFLARHAERLRPPAAILMIDIDWMKRLNDTYGFLVGDGTLRRTATLINEHVAWPEYVVRYGGEEFVVILPGVSLEAARERAEQIRSAAEPAYVITEYDDKEYMTATLSIGIAMLGSDFADAIRQADENLIRAKEQGRNRVVG